MRFFSTSLRHFNLVDVAIVKLISAFVLVLCLPALAQQSSIELSQIRDLYERVNKICPPETCHLISLGRSGTPVMAVREALHPEASSTLPLSGFSLPEGDVYDLDHSYRWNNVKEEAHRRFRIFLPQADKIGDKTVMVMDFTASGGSLFSGYHIIRDYYQKFVPELHIEAVALVAELRLDLMIRIAKVYHVKTNFIPLSFESPVLFSLLRQSYDSWAKYQKAPLEVEGKRFEPRAEYYQFQNRVLEHMGIQVDLNSQQETGIESEQTPACESLFFSSVKRYLQKIK